MQNRLSDFYYQIPSSPVAVGFIVAVVGTISGLLLAFGGPLVGAGILIAAIAGLIVLSNMEIGIWGVIGVVCILPFATLPFKIVITPTFLDLALGGVFAVWALRLVTGRQTEVVTGPVTFPLIIFILVTLFAFVFGMPNGPLTSQLLRKFSELILSLVFVVLLVDFCRDWERLERLVRMVLLAGTGAAVIGIVLWLLPDETANDILNLLVRFGYPEGFVIRYVEDNPAELERAIGTSVDPNVYGGLLVLIGTLAAPQLVAKRSIFWGKRWLAWGAFLSVFVALILTNSRGALVGLAAGVGFLALIRYRQLIPWGVAALAVLVLFIFPPTQNAITSAVRFVAGESTADLATAYTERLSEGFQGEDLATQMRFGEYQDAISLIQRYPLFGVGFAGSPDIDLYLGVASVYLTIGQQMGVLGLISFAVVVGSVFYQAWQARGLFENNPDRDPIWLGLHSAIFAGLVVGIFDHYLFNLEFLHAVTIFWMLLGLAVAATRLELLRDR
ncbi:MAG: O-antigen ligase family protein [Anaerolineae bacterium]